MNIQCEWLPKGKGKEVAAEMDHDSEDQNHAEHGDGLVLAGLQK